MSGDREDFVRRALAKEKPIAQLCREYGISRKTGHKWINRFRERGAVGLVDGHRCEIPLTQTDLAEATGMTPVHVNRMVQELRARGLIRWKGREFEAIDLDGLCDVAMFNATYLHLDHEGRHLDANG